MIDRFLAAAIMLILVALVLEIFGVRGEPRVIALLTCFFGYIVGSFVESGVRRL